MKKNTAGDLLERTQGVLHTTRVDMANRCGVGRTTFIDWIYGKKQPKPEVLTKLAADVFAIDKSLAAELAAHANVTLESLGFVEKTKPSRAAVPSTGSTPPAQLRHLSDSVILAAAEMLDRSPSFVRPILIAAFERADAVGLTVREVLAGLREGAATATTSRPSTERQL
jgi:hypothetical protein